ncbi:MAG: hypothetical protein M1820_000416 [Bogoriella megaspora]|nr:MAG: hypothetical protein M1820_000416 [Bogoriella megaspora]
MANQDAYPSEVVPDAERPDNATNTADLGEPDLIMTEEGGPVHDPPSHVAARFYSSGNGRRKSSAASSRRNSVSSTHSHHSSRSFRGACNDTYIAQHLRRASIIETRKARLADRAAHAEQVRLRAALAKATPKTSNSEERALAAQQARERHLAQVAAACAEEVKRAKKVAEDMKKLKAAEEKRNRLEIEEKHAEADKRRAEYRKNGRRARTTSSPAGLKKVVEEPGTLLDEDEAARRIQRLWRSNVRRNALNAFNNIGLSIERARDMEFEEVSKLLAEDAAMNATYQLLKLFPLQATDSGSTLDKSTARIFLSAYVILSHPATILNSSDGPQEQDLITKAKDLLICFEEVLGKASPENRYNFLSDQMVALTQAHTSFVTAFTAWKAQDSSVLVETMIANFVELDAIWQDVKNDTRGEVTNDYKEGIRMNQALLLTKIKKLAGHDRASFLIKRAIVESRRSRARSRKKPTGDVRPRAAVDAQAQSNSSGVGGDSSQVDQAVAHLDQSGQVGQSGDSLTTELGKIFSPLPDNRTIVHELAIDKEYRIDTNPQSEIRDALNRQLCDDMRRAVEQGEGPAWTVAMAENIRRKLLRLLRPGTSYHTLVSETLDTTLIQTQTKQGVFSYEKFFSFMGGLLPLLCAPFRDAEVKAVVDEFPREGADTGDMIDKLFKLLHIVDLLSLDYSNFLLTNAAPTLLRESEGYERRQFAQDLESGAITLQRTRHWWHNASVNAVTEAAQRDPEGINNPADRPTFHKIYIRGLADLALSAGPLQDSDIPETLSLDRDRIMRLRSDALRITTIGAILLTAKNLLKRDVRSQWKPESQRLWDLFKDNAYGKDDASIPVKVLSILESSHAMPPATRSQLSSAVGRFLTQAATGSATNVPVMRVLFQRLKAHILARASLGSLTNPEHVRAATTATEGLAGSGLPEFSSQVGQIVETLGRISDVDRRAHGTWYDDIAREIEAGARTAHRT